MHNQFQHIEMIMGKLFELGCTHFVISGGSRNAPIIQAIQNWGGQCFSIFDERSAAYLALGLSKGLNAPVAVVTTSGTAALNLVPGIAEAFYQSIPVIAITADRPKGEQESYANQSINQVDVFQPYVQKAWDLEVFQDKFQFDLQWTAFKKPIHLNIRLQEPLYELSKTKIQAETTLSFCSREENLDMKLPSLEEGKKVMAILGLDNDNVEQLNPVTFQLPILADMCSSFQFMSNILNFNYFLKQKEDVKILAPEILVSYGTYHLSKTLRQFLIENPPQLQIHFGDKSYVSPFTSNLQIIKPCPDSLLLMLSKIKSKPFLSKWEEADQKKQLQVDRYANTNIVQLTLEQISVKVAINHFHAGNSMSARYADLFLRNTKMLTRVICNRGTSGIDGSLSTFFGYCHALPIDNHLLVIGDLSLLYDVNGFFARAKMRNFIILVLNNQGGGIFKMVKGTQELDDKSYNLVEMPHQSSMEKLAQMHNLKYRAISSMAEIQSIDQKSLLGSILELSVSSAEEAKQLQKLYDA